MTAMAVAERYPNLASSENFPPLLALRLIAAEDALAAAVAVSDLDAGLAAHDRLVDVWQLLHELGLYDKVSDRLTCIRLNTPDAVSEVSIPDIPLAGLAPSDTVNDEVA